MIRVAFALFCALTALQVIFSAPAAAAATKCFAQASARYGVPAELLRAISHVESGGNPSAMNVNKNGSTDIGHMQINSAWLPTLARHGITSKHLMQPCTNTQVGAWILAANIRRLGYNWRAVGAYNASNKDKATTYARKVAVAMQKLQQKESGL
ncbi:MAG: lytic transglycosylase domain-containing protein [Gallionella sp.]|nr:lytic transglycosylase domain-containing protein [Gallionella sp.]